MRVSKLAPTITFCAIAGLAAFMAFKTVEASPVANIPENKHLGVSTHSVNHVREAFSMWSGGAVEAAPRAACCNCLLPFCRPNCCPTEKASNV